MMSLQDWLQQAGISYNQNENGASQPGNYTTSYGPLWDAAQPTYGGINKSEDMTPEQYMQSIYSAASDPSYGSAGLSYGDLKSGKGFFSDIAPVTLNGRSYLRLGNQANPWDKADDSSYRDILAKYGGPDQFISNNDQYGRLWDVSNPMGARAYGEMSQKSSSTHGQQGFIDWLPQIFMTVASMGAPAAGAAAGIGAAAGGAAAGGAAAGEGAAAGAAGGWGGMSEATLGQLARAGVSTTGGTMNGGSPWGGLAGMAGTALGASGMLNGIGGADTGGYSGGGSMFDWGGGLAEDAGMSANDWYAQQVMDGGGDLSSLYGSLDSNPFAGAIAEASGGTDWSKLLGTGGSALAKLLGGGGGSSVLGRLFGGGGSGSDWGSLLGGLGSSALGYFGARDQMQGYKDMQDKSMAMGQPYRDRLNASYQPGFDLASQDPAYQGALDQSSNSVLRKLSASGGNPYGNPGGLMEANKYVMQNTALPQLNTYRSQLGTFGQFGVNQAGTQGAAAVQAGGGQYDALGAGLQSLTKQNTSLSDLAAKYNLTSGWNN